MNNKIYAKYFVLDLELEWDLPILQFIFKPLFDS